MDVRWLGHVGSEAQGEVSETEERVFVQDMLKYLFFVQVFEGRPYNKINKCTNFSNFILK
jgi:hypothetical protein